MSSAITTTDILSAEENFEILVENYITYEKEVYGVLIQKLLRGSGLSSINFFDERRPINLYLANFLTSSRSYLDHLEGLSKRHPELKIKESIISPEYDNNPEYKFIYKLRNHIQHSSAGIHKQEFGSFSVLGDEDGQNCYLSLHTDVSRLADDTFGKTFLSSYPGVIDLNKFLRVFVGCLSEIHAKVRLAIKSNADAFKTLDNEPDERKVDTINRLIQKNHPTDSIKRINRAAVT